MLRLCASSAPIQRGAAQHHIEGTGRLNLGRSVTSLARLQLVPPRLRRRRGRLATVVAQQGEGPHEPNKRPQSSGNRQSGGEEEPKPDFKAAELTLLVSLLVK